MLEINLLSHRETHAGTLVNHQLAAQVGLFLVAFHEKFLRAPVEFPVDMPNRLARVVQTMLRKLHREAMEGALVKPRDEAFHNLARQKIEAAEGSEVVSIDGELCHLFVQSWLPLNPLKGTLTY